MPGGWGRRAAGHSEHKLEDDELFKEIGGQLKSTNFDYSQWQRTDKKAPLQRTSTLQNVLTGDVLSAKVERPSTVKSSATSGSRNSHRRAVSAASSDCIHSRKKSQERQKDETAERKKAEQIKILQLRIHARRRTIADYKKRKKELFEANMQLQDDIDREEAESHEKVKQLLRKYEKFQGGIATLNDRFSDELGKVKVDLQEAKLQIKKENSELQAEVDSLDQTLHELHTEVHTLINYKDKEYPVKALRISDLQKEIENIHLQYQEEEEELKHIVDNEIDKFHKEQEDSKRTLTEDITQEAIGKMHPSLKDMALQNLVMQKEIDFHIKEISELEGSNKTLQKEVKQLLKDPKSSLRTQMFPELFPTRQKCTPDMDIVLDIPTQEWLPI